MKSSLEIEKDNDDTDRIMIYWSYYDFGNGVLDFLLYLFPLETSF